MKRMYEMVSEKAKVSITTSTVRHSQHRHSIEKQRATESVSKVAYEARKNDVCSTD